MFCLFGHTWGIRSGWRGVFITSCNNGPPQDQWRQKSICLRSTRCCIAAIHPTAGRGQLENYTDLRDTIASVSHLCNMVCTFSKILPEKQVFEFLEVNVIQWDVTHGWDDTFKPENQWTLMSRGWTATPWHLGRRCTRAESEHLWPDCKSRWTLHGLNDPTASSPVVQFGFVTWTCKEGDKKKKSTLYWMYCQTWFRPPAHVEIKERWVGEWVS